MKRLLTFTVCAAMALSATSAFADSLADTINARSSTEATVGLHIALGGKARQVVKPEYGASVGFRAGGQTVSQSLTTPSAKIAEVNFSGGKVEEARVGAYDFAKSDSALPAGDRLGFDSGSTTIWLWVALGVVAAWYVVDQNNNDNHHRSAD